MCWPGRRLGLPNRIKSWSLTSLQHRLIKTGGRLVKHARYYWLLLAEGHLNRKLFGEMLGRIWALPLPSGQDGPLPMRNYGTLVKSKEYQALLGEFMEKQKAVEALLDVNKPEAITK